MQRIFYITFILIGMVGNLMAQYPKLSAGTLAALYNKNTNQAVRSKTGNTIYYNGMIKVNNAFDGNILKKNGIIVGTKAGNIWTVRIPEQALLSLSKLQNISAIELDEPMVQNMDMARKYSGVDSVHQAINLPATYTGKGVVVGIIDAGFDYIHPAFYDTTGTQIRVKRVWEQHKPGTPPSGFTYGSELKTFNEFEAAQTDVADGSHATHVGGIAAGSGVGSTDNTYRGIAYESDLVFVAIRPEQSEWRTAGMSTVVDAVNYIYTYAASVQKPAVINLSWGSTMGPCDGSGLFAQAVDNITGSGKIFVISAGNNGDNKVHLTKANPSDTLVHSFVNLPNVDSEKRTWIDIWGRSDTAVCAQLSLYGAGIRTDETVMYCSSDTIPVHNGYLIGTDGDTLFFDVIASVEANGKSRVIFDVFSKSSNSLCVSIGSKGAFHARLGYPKVYIGYYGSFAKNGISWATDGNSEYTIGEMASTRSAITVGAFVSKVSFKNLAGATQSYSGYTSFGKLAPFSSHGPTGDERIKPDIAAPGMTLASAVNSFDVGYLPNGSNYSSSVTKYTSPINNRDYYYAHASGTSMSSPVVSGIVALMLQINPFLTPDSVKYYLNLTATKDTHTGAIPNKNLWGGGKVNAYRAIQHTIQMVGISESILEQNNALLLFPNPAINKLSLQVSNSAIKAIKIYTITGQQVFEKQAALNNQTECTIDVSQLHFGLYQCVVELNNGSTITKRWVKE